MPFFLMKLRVYGIDARFGVIALRFGRPFGRRRAMLYLANRSCSLLGGPDIKGLTMLQNYVPVLIFMGVGLGLGVILTLAGWAVGKLLGRHKNYEAKNKPFECGFDAFEDARLKFDVRFYLVAILFIIFDLEIAFLFPWAIVLNTIGWFGFWSMIVFLGLLVIGFVYEWKKGALEWE